MAVKKVTTEDIRALEIGEEAVFKVPHPRDVNTARVLASNLGTYEPERGIRYRTNANYAKCEITITAEKR